MAGGTGKRRPAGAWVAGLSGTLLALSVGLPLFADGPAPAAAPDPHAPAAPAADSRDGADPAPGADPFATDDLLRTPVEPLQPGADGAPESPSEDAVADESRFHLKGYLENETAFRTSRPNEFSKILNVFQAEGTWCPLDELDLVAVLRAHYDAVFDVENGFSDEAENAYEAEVDLREAYLDYHHGAWRVRAGRQQIVWGDTIGLKVLDLVDPQDFREFILDDFVDSRIPLYSLRVEWLAGAAGPFQDVTLEGIWIPHLRFHEPAEPGSEYAFVPPEFPPGVRVVQNRATEPSESLEHAEWGLRVRSVVDEWDLSLSYFHTWDDTPVSFRRFDPATFTLTVDPEHRRAQVVGASVTNAFGKFVLSAEVAWWVRRAFDSEDLTEKRGVVRKDFLNAGLSADTDLFGIDVGMQYFQSVILDYDSDLVPNRTQSAASLHLRKTLLRDDLALTGFLLHDLETDDEWLHLQAAYDVTDHLTVTLGTDLLEGKERGLLGQFDHTDRVFLEVKLGF